MDATRGATLRGHIGVPRARAIALALTATVALGASYAAGRIGAGPADVPAPVVRHGYGPPDNPNINRQPVHPVPAPAVRHGYGPPDNPNINP
jgi:hypothetical protein